MGDSGHYRSVSLSCSLPFAYTLYKLSLLYLGVKLVILPEDGGWGYPEKFGGGVKEKVKSLFRHGISFKTLQ